MPQDLAEGIVIRLARPQELPYLTEIELDAYGTLAEARGGELSAPALPQDILRRSLQDQLLFVAAASGDQPVGFLVGTERDGVLYVEEIDVARVWQRRGVGRRLMSTAIDTARTSRLLGVTLTTDRFVPFNAPFYTKLGFVEISDKDRVPQLRRTLEREMSISDRGDRRVAMILRFS